MPCTERVATSRIREVALDELHVRYVGQIGALAGDQAVHDADAFTATSQFFTEMRSDETGAAGHKVVSHRGSYCGKPARGRPGTSFSAFW